MYGSLTVNVGDSSVPTGQSPSWKPFTRPAPTKPVTGLCPSRAPDAGDSPHGPSFQLPGSLLSVQPSKVPSSKPANTRPAGVDCAPSVLSLVKVVPSNSPTKYCPPLPPPTAPGLRLTTMTHFVFFGSPSTGSSNRSGHSQMPPVELAGPKSDRWSQFLRSALLYSTTL